MAIKITIHTHQIMGKDVYTIRDFATVIGKSDQTVLDLIHRGNKIRKLKTVRLDGRPFVLASELTEFPFTVSGRGDEIYYYNSKGGIDHEKSKIQKF